MPKPGSDADAHSKERSRGNGRAEQRSKEIAGRTVSRPRTYARPRSTSPNRRLEDRTVAELRERAKVLGINGRSKMNKAELVQAIRRKNG